MTPSALVQATKSFKKMDPSATQTDDAQAKLKDVSSLSAADSKELARRKMIAKTKLTTYAISKGPKYGSNEKVAATLTAEMLATGEWKNVKFKPCAPPPPS